MCCLKLSKKNGAKDKVRLDNYCGTSRIKATTVLRRINTLALTVIEEGKFKAKKDFEDQFSK